ncbi:MAG: UDP-N-acetylmuramoyl-L-alanine--D-glutamate ligase [bacterium]
MGNKLQLEGKNIHIIGLGAKGTGRACAEVLGRMGANITISDSKSPEILADEVGKLQGKGITFLLGDDAYKGIENANLVIPSPGVPMTIEPIRRAIAHDVPVLSEIEIAYRISEAPIIAITGTKGKTTTTTLVGLLLEACGIETYVGGNIGKPLIELAEIAPKDSILVAEVSSFQLEAVKNFAPHIAIFTNLYPDHLDRYDYSMELYLRAKMNLFRQQLSSDYIILHETLPEQKSILKFTDAHCVFVSVENEISNGVYIHDGVIYSGISGSVKKIADLKDIRLRGEHNLGNILQAIAAVNLVTDKVSEVAAAVLADFKGVANRLEEVDTINGVTFYNDSQGTTPIAVRMALAAFAPDKPVLIAGGRAKIADFTELGMDVVKYAKAVILIGEAADLISDAIAKADSNFPVYRSATLPDAVNKAFEIAGGSAVVMSPACASFDMFTNMEHRGDVFRAAVAELKKKNS